jgi:hypothetical protein
LCNTKAALTIAAVKRLCVTVTWLLIGNASVLATCSVTTTLDADVVELDTTLLNCCRRSPWDSPPPNIRIPYHQIQQTPLPTLSLAPVLIFIQTMLAIQGMSHLKLDYQDLPLFVKVSSISSSPATFVVVLAV